MDRQGMQIGDLVPPWNILYCDEIPENKDSVLCNFIFKIYTTHSGPGKYSINTCDINNG